MYKIVQWEIDDMRMTYLDSDDLSKTIRYDILKLENGLMITGVNLEKGSNLERLLIPSYINGNHVVVVGILDKRELFSVKEILVEYGVEKISNFCFDGCSSLEKVRIPETVKNIKKNAFRGCYHLSSVVVADDCIVEESAFEKNCEILKKTNTNCPILYKYSVNNKCRNIRDFNKKVNEVDSSKSRKKVKQSRTEKVPLCIQVLAGDSSKDQTRHNRSNKDIKKRNPQANKSSGIRKSIAKAGRPPAYASTARRHKVKLWS